jgi:hypothetical protein
MATKPKFSVDREREKLEGFYRKLRSIVQTTLDNLEESGDTPSAALLDSLVKSVRSLGQLLTDLESQAESRARRAKADAVLAEARQSAPFALANAQAPRPGTLSPPAETPADTDLHDPAFDDAPPAGVELPFKLKAS